MILIQVIFFSCNCYSRRALEIQFRLTFARAWLVRSWMGAAQSISITNKGGSLLNPNETIGSVSHVRFENITSISENSAVFVSSCTQTGNSTYNSHGHCTAGLPDRCGTVISFQFFK
jgi:hypothetical protein